MVTLVAALAGCQAYDRAFYRALVNEAGADAGDITASLDTGSDARADTTTADAFDAADASDDIGRSDAVLTDVPAVEDVVSPPDVQDEPPACDAGFGPNTIANPGFESGLLPWGSYVEATAAATISVTTNNPHSGSNCLEANVTTSGPNEYDVQLGQNPLSVHSGRAVHVEAWFRAATPHMMSIVLEQSSPPYTNYCYWSANVSTSWTLLAFECTPTVTDPTTLIVINLSQIADTVAVDDVSFSEFQSCP